MNEIQRIRIQASYKLSKAEYMSAQHLHYMRKTSSQFILFTSYFLYPLIGLLALRSWIIHYRAHALADNSILKAAAYSFLIIIPFIFYFNLRRGYSRSRVNDNVCNIEFTEDQIKSELPEFGTSTLEWKALRQFDEGRRIILIYFSDTRFMAIPKRALAAGQAEALLRLLSTKLRMALQT